VNHPWRGRCDKRVAAAVGPGAELEQAGRRGRRCCGHRCHGGGARPPWPDRVGEPAQAGRRGRGRRGGGAGHGRSRARRWESG
jgi:hypothetical protein